MRVMMRTCQTSFKTYPDISTDIHCNNMPQCTTQGDVENQNNNKNKKKAKK
eukprot:m.224473 g.224473  ORF g.224473 m.224473 type:complete len:51 (-) comp34274_c0_seq1:57-209(-)